MADDKAKKVDKIYKLPNTKPWLQLEGRKLQYGNV
jgi:hypothetical protein